MNSCCKQQDHSTHLLKTSVIWGCTLVASGKGMPAQIDGGSQGHVSSRTCPHCGVSAPMCSRLVVCVVLCLVFVHSFALLCTDLPSVVQSSKNTETGCWTQPKLSECDRSRQTHEIAERCTGFHAANGLNQLHAVVCCVLRHAKKQHIESHRPGGDTHSLGRSPSLV